MSSPMFIHRKLLRGQRNSKWPRTVKLHQNHLSKKVLYLVLHIFEEQGNRPCRPIIYNAGDICPKYVQNKEITITYTSKKERKEICP